MPEPPDVIVWTVKEAAAYLRLSTSAIYKMTARKATIRIPHVRIAGRLRFRRVDLDAWLDLLTVSDLDTLKKTRPRARRADGVDTQEEARER